MSTDQAAVPAAVTPALAGSVTLALPVGAGRDGSGTGPVTGVPARHTGVTGGTVAVTGTVTQVSTEIAGPASRLPAEIVTRAVPSVTPSVTETVTPPVTGREASRTRSVTVTAGGITAVTGVPTPVTAGHPAGGQLDVNADANPREGSHVV